MNSVERSTFVVYGGWKEPHEVEREVHQLLGVISVSWGGGGERMERTTRSRA